MAAGIDSDDDDFLLASQQEASPPRPKFLRRLKKAGSRTISAAPSVADVSPKPLLTPAFSFSSYAEPASSPIGTDLFPTERSTGCGTEDTEISDDSLHQVHGSEFLDKDEEREDGDTLHTDHSSEFLDENEEQEGDEEAATLERAKLFQKPLDDLSDGEEGGIADEKDEDSAEDSDSEDEIDEDDEAAILNLLGKEKKMSVKLKLNESDVTSTPPAAPSEKEVSGRSGKKKAKVAELEEMHAQSQRLLRESSNVAFKPQQAMGKSISSVLEKIRMRKMQLVQRFENTPILCEERVDVAQSDEVEAPSECKDALADLHGDFVKTDIDVQEMATEIKDSENLSGDISESPMSHHYVCVQEKAQNVQENAVEEVNNQSTSKEPMGQHKSDAIASILSGRGSAFRAPLEDTQDLCYQSQVDHEDEPGEAAGVTCPEEEELNNVNLQIDTETLDDFEHWVDEDVNKDSDPVVPDSARLPARPSVRALIDDEAEDEDEGDLVPGDDDEPDDGEDLKDMVVQDNNEGTQDKHKRAELHRKWLEQQDDALTDDILLRLKTGWKPRENRKRGFECLDDENDNDDGDSDDEDEGGCTLKEVDETQSGAEAHRLLGNSQELEPLGGGGSPGEVQPFKDSIEVDEMHESSDDDEAEQTLLRQRFLQESEEQEEIILPADDESSREVLVLINKVNVPTLKKSKLGTGETRFFGVSSNSNSSLSSKSSFLRKTPSPSVQSAQRQSSGGSGVRSFIFGRDDSNSSHSLSNGDRPEEVKENVDPSQGLRKGLAERSPAGRARSSQKPAKASRLGPSLFEILKRQTTDMEPAQQSKSSQPAGPHSPTLNTPIFAAFRPMKPTTRASRVG